VYVFISLSDEKSEQISDYMESIVGNLAPAAISNWLKRVAEYAMELCPDSGIEFRTLGDFGDIVIPTREVLYCVIDSIKVHEEQAPELVRTVLAAYRTRLEQEL
jgi:hypothetical protein